MNEKFFDLNSEKQDRMINAALKLFAVNGYKHASTDEIVKAAGISKGLLFHYFVSKAGLYAFLIDYSVRYLLNEYTRVIGDERDYFVFREKLEQAKTNVLRNYPYMYDFVEQITGSADDDLDQTSKDSVISYNKSMESYWNRLKVPALKEGIDITKVDNLIGFTTTGLTREALNSEKYQPEQLYKQICEYIDLIKKMTIKE